MKTNNKKGRLDDGSPNPIDIHVGSRIRLRREVLRLSQSELSSLLGVSYQQLQKYELGNSRVSASRLWDIGKTLKVGVEFFYQEMTDKIIQQSPMMFNLSEGENICLREDSVDFDSDPMQKKETIELVTAYYKISNRKSAKHLYDLVIAMSKNGYDSEE